MNPVSTTQLVQSTAGVLTRDQAAAKARCTPETARDIVGVGDHDEAVLSREVNFIPRYHEQRKKYVQDTLRNAES